MTYNVKKTFAMLLLAIFGSVLLYNCEPDPDSLGEQLFIKDATEGNEISYPLIAYNFNNNDSIRSDASKLINTIGSPSSTAVLGAFSEDQFGMQKASYLTQLRLPTDNPDFGANAVVDSVVLAIRPNSAQYATDSVSAPGPVDRTDFPSESGNIAVSIDKKTYPIYKYGKRKIGGSPALFNIRVHEVTTFLDANATPFTRSNISVDTGDLLGSGVFDGKVSSVTVTKKSDNSSVFTSNVGFRIKLDKNFFQSKIIAKKGQPELQDASNFTRYFKGLRISVDETDGYLFQFSPNDMEMIMYYKSDKTDANNVVTRPQTKLSFVLGAANAHIGQYAYNRTGSNLKSALDSSSKDNGDPKLYTQAMGGPSIAVKIPSETIDKLKTLYQNDKAAIISAKVRIYTDDVNWKNSYPKPTKPTLLQVDSFDTNGAPVSSAFTQDMLAGFIPVKSYDLDKNPAYYDFTITKTVKDIVESGKDNKVMIINLGEFLPSSSSAFAGYKYTSRAFAMDRAVFVGTDKTNPNNPKGIQLKVTYGTKK